MLSSSSTIAAMWRRPQLSAMGICVLLLPPMIHAETIQFGRYILPDDGTSKSLQLSLSIDPTLWTPLGYDGNGFVVRKNDGTIQFWNMSLGGATSQVSGKKLDINLYQVVGHANGKALIQNISTNTYYRLVNGSPATWQSLRKWSAPQFSLQAFSGNMVVFKNEVNGALIGYWYNDAGTLLGSRTIGNIADKEVLGCDGDSLLVKYSTGTFYRWQTSSGSKTVVQKIGSFPADQWRIVGFTQDRVICLNLLNGNAIRVYKLEANGTKGAYYNYGLIDAGFDSIAGDQGYVTTGATGPSFWVTKNAATISCVTISGTVSDDAVMASGVGVELYRGDLKVSKQTTTSKGSFIFCTAPFSNIQEYKVKVLGTP